MTEAKTGAWFCAHCGQLERSEREIICWNCGKGEMVFSTNVFDFIAKKAPGLVKMPNLSSAHVIDVKVRTDGIDRWYQADWLKYIQPK